MTQEKHSTENGPLNAIVVIKNYRLGKATRADAVAALRVLNDYIAERKSAAVCRRVSVRVSATVRHHSRREVS